MGAYSDTVSHLLGRAVAYVFDRKGGAAPFILRTAACTWLAIAACLTTANSVFTLPALDEPATSIREEILLGIVLAPLLENIFMIGVIELLDAHSARPRTIVVAVASMSGLLHAWGFGWRGIAGFIGFATLSYSYLIWKKRGFVRSYAVTLCQHALLNVPATALKLLSG